MDKEIESRKKMNKHYLNYLFTVYCTVMLVVFICMLDSKIVKLNHQMTINNTVIKELQTKVSELEKK